MIRELIDPLFVKARVGDVASYLNKRKRLLDSPPASLVKSAAEAGISIEDLANARHRLEKLVVDGDFSRQDGQAAWMPRDADLGVVQSALEEFYRDQDAEHKTVAKGFAEQPDPVSDESLADAWRPTAARSFMRSMEESDWLGWGLSFVIAKAIEGVNHKADFKEQDVPVQIESNARLVLMGDWGSAVRRAKAVGKQIEEQLKPANAGNRERHLIHLGDVYYAGREFEYQRVLECWPVNESDAEKIGSWCLNGNHDMFSGGKPLYKFLGDPRFKKQNGCTYFALENKDWLVFGLDSAFESEGGKGDAGGLAGGQAEWIMKQIRRAPHKKVMLLSHHQPFSAWENESPLLVEKLQPILQRDTPVAAWFWGHEHRWAVYEPAHNINYPALIGHGGVPVYASSEQPNPEREKVRAWDRRSFRHLLESYSYLGFAVLDLDGAEGTVHYIDENGKPTKPDPDRVA
jgi:hypothetical protein